jgi:hypothetical protein
MFWLEPPAVEGKAAGRAGEGAAAGEVKGASEELVAGEAEAAGDD